jgi:hypothetical protein
LVDAECVLVPYRDYYQSDVAVRAVEAGVPVVGLRHEFIVSLLGADWPGLVEAPHAEAWIHAIIAARSADVTEAARPFLVNSEAEWRAYLVDLVEN